MDYDAVTSKIEAKIKARFESRKHDILAWGKYYFPEKFTLPFCEELHRYFIEIAEEPRTSTLAPREHAKTTIKCFLIPLYYALNYPEKFKYYLNVQNTTTKAIDINNSIKLECEENERLIRDYGVLDKYGNKTLKNETKWTEKQFVLPNGVVFGALGAGESIRGINFKNRRPDYIIVDDLYDDGHIHNPNLIKKVNSWFWSSLYPARASSKKNCIHVQGTAIHKTDLMHSFAPKRGEDGKLIESRWKYKKFQAIKNYDTQEVLWKENPAKTFESLLEDRVDMGTIIFDREMQNECRSDETSIVKEHMIKYYKHSHFAKKYAGSAIISYCGLDPAIGEKAENDFSGYAICHFDEEDNVFIENISYAKNSFDANIKQGDSWNTKYKPRRFGLEAIAGFKGLAGEFRRRVKNFPLKEISRVKDKITRFENQSYRWENGKVYFNSEMDTKNLQELENQILNNYPEHDDVRDAVLICMELAEQKPEVRIRTL